MTNEELLLLEDICPILHIGKTTHTGLYSPVSFPPRRLAANGRLRPMISEITWPENSAGTKTEWLAVFHCRLLQVSLTGSIN